MASIVAQSDPNGPKMGPKWSKKGPKCPKWVQNGSKTGPKWVQNGSQKGFKRGSQNGSPRGRNQKKVELDDSPNARLVGETCLRAQWFTTPRVTSHCAPFSRMCASTYEVHMPQCPPEAPKGHPKHPNGLMLAQSGVNIDPHGAKKFKMGQTGSKLVHRLA